MSFTRKFLNPRANDYQKAPRRRNRKVSFFGRFWVLISLIFWISPKGLAKAALEEKYFCSEVGNNKIILMGIFNFKCI